MNGPASILLAKLANDAGFAVELGETDGWLAFAIPGCNLRLWLPGQCASCASYLAWHRARVFRSE